MFSQKVLVFAVLIVLVSMVAASPLQRDWANTMVLQEFCVLQGGVCLPIDDCDPQNRVLTPMKLNLCSEQSGLECCYQY